MIVLRNTMMRKALSMSCAVVDRRGPVVPVGEEVDTADNVASAGRAVEAHA